MQQPMPNGSILRSLLPRPVSQETGRIALQNVVPKRGLGVRDYANHPELKRLEISIPCRRGDLSMQIRR
jgi:hypothetical protein